MGEWNGLQGNGHHHIFMELGASLTPLGNVCKPLVRRLHYGSRPFPASIVPKKYGELIHSPPGTWFLGMGYCGLALSAGVGLTLER